MLPAIPVIIAGLAVAAYYKQGQREKEGELTPERRAVFIAARDTILDPYKLETIADAFEAEHLDAYAQVLRLRAQLRRLPPEVRKARRDVFKKALRCTDPVAVETMARAFEEEYALGSAAKLREYAATLRQNVVAAGGTPAVNAPPVPTPVPNAEFYKNELSNPATTTSSDFAPTSSSTSTANPTSLVESAIGTPPVPLAPPQATVSAQPTPPLSPENQGVT